MDKSICSFADCGKPLRAKGLCAGHWRQRHKGRELTPLRPSGVPAAEKFPSMYRPEPSGCWIWTGPSMQTGYGYVHDGGRVILAHRLAYEIVHGTIPSGTIIDHMCRVTLCVNPNHLQVATKKMNGENVGLSKANTSGVRGVCWDKRNKSWIASVKHNYVKHHVGRFKSLAEAEAAVIAKRNELFTNNLADRT